MARKDTAVADAIKVVEDAHAKLSLLELELSNASQQLDAVKAARVRSDADSQKAANQATGHVDGNMWERATEMAQLLPSDEAVVFAECIQMLAKFMDGSVCQNILDAEILFSCGSSANINSLNGGSDTAFGEQYVGAS